MEEWAAKTKQHIETAREDVCTYSEEFVDQVKQFFGADSALLAIVESKINRINEELTDFVKEIEEQREDAKECMAYKYLCFDIVPFIKLETGVRKNVRYNVRINKDVPFTGDREFHLPLALLYVRTEKSRETFANTISSYGFQNRSDRWMTEIGDNELIPRFCHEYCDDCNSTEWDFMCRRYQEDSKMMVVSFASFPNFDFKPHSGVVLRLKNYSQILVTDSQGNVSFDWFTKLMDAFHFANLIQCYVETDQISEKNLLTLITLFYEAQKRVSINLTLRVKDYYTIVPALEKLIKSCTVFNFTDEYFKLLVHFFGREKLPDMMAHIRHVVIKDSNEIVEFLEQANLFSRVESIDVPYTRSNRHIRHVLKFMINDTAQFPRLVDLHFTSTVASHAEMHISDTRMRRLSGTITEKGWETENKFDFGRESNEEAGCDEIKQETAVEKYKNTANCIVDFLATRDAQVFEYLGIIGSNNIAAKGTRSHPNYLYTTPDNDLNERSGGVHVFASEKRYIKMLA